MIRLSLPRFRAAAVGKAWRQSVRYAAAQVDEVLMNRLRTEPTAIAAPDEICDGLFICGLPALRDHLDMFQARGVRSVLNAAESDLHRRAGLDLSQEFDVHVFGAGELRDDMDLDPEEVTKTASEATSSPGTKDVSRAATAATSTRGQVPIDRSPAPPKAAGSQVSEKQRLPADAASPTDQKATLQALQSLASASFLQDTGLVPDSVRDSAADCSLKFCFDPQGHVPCMNKLQKVKRSEYEAIWRRFCTDQAQLLSDEDIHRLMSGAGGKGAPSKARDAAAVYSLLRRAGRERHVAATAANERSSRSHAVVQLALAGRCTVPGKLREFCTCPSAVQQTGQQREVSGLLSFVDLAGSERLERSGAVGDRLKEAQHINRSLCALGDVIEAICRKGALKGPAAAAVHVPPGAGTA
eukprot:s78_g50.t1